VIQAVRRCQAPEALAADYAPPGVVEGTLSQGVSALGLRKTRYRGLAELHLSHVGTAAAINLVRLAAWLDGMLRETFRRSPFAALAAASRSPSGTLIHQPHFHGTLTQL